MERLKRIKRHLKIRKYLTGTNKRPRLMVFRSNQHIYAQLIDDSKHLTIVSESDLSLEKDNKTSKSFTVGKKVAENAVKLGIKEVVFDRGGFLYHGRVLKLAQGAREGGLKF